MLFRLFAVVLCLSITACSSWVYRIDIPQGNYLEQKDIDKLQIEMTKEQVKYVLGSPVVADSFNPDVWHYVYRFKSGRNSEFDSNKKFIIKFKDNKLISAEGDFELPESFYTPMIN
ncbi:outer membrane protein assembly factor BamE [Thalassotalea piscium]|uniref:Outer membrane protein assembly factor BamE n=1 Tax=Thalassotalea piscium TaxID=1230533 RepID=A0A7X0NJP1_9GAMM|nr:outer membrane protein assembly factor BamE [Thalassotalea piscium]MBB6544551.1 outer membrane protein assembly factor BamE [Thalassotalea piscium]